MAGNKAKQRTDEPKLRIIPLGGLGEIGKNMTVFEYGDDILVVDVGSIFPKEDMPGVDLVIPDVTYLTKNASRIRGYVFTHGHEDHIGAAPYILRNLPAPIYGTRLTLALIDHKLKEHKLAGIVEYNTIEPHDVVEIGAFRVEFLKVSHSIAGAVMLAIHTPVGCVVHTGDFKVDYTPIDGEVMDLRRLAEIGQEGVLLLLADSTNVERTGYTMSEKTVGETFANLFGKADGRIFVAMFASNVHRIQQVVDAAVRFNRKVCLVGRSMLNISKLAIQLGYLKIPEGRLVTIDDLDRYDDNELIIMTTGSQGEAMSGLTRMAFAEHKKLDIKKTDMVIVSATPIPGNEKAVARVLNQLVRTGANVIYEALAEVHVSGHARQEELKLVHTLANPKFFMPVHGEYRHLYHHARLAMALGMPEDHVHIADVGEIIELTNTRLSVAGTVPSGEVLIDGLGIGDVGAVVLRDRKLLSQDGLMMIIMAIDHLTGMVVAGPDIISRGFVYMREADALLEGTRLSVRAALEAYGRIDPSDWNHVKNEVREAAHRYIYESLKRSPMILPVIVEV